MTVNVWIDRARVIATSAITWITAAVAVLQFVLTQEVVADIPNASQYIAQAVTALTGVIVAIRRVTPVASGEHSLL